MSVNLGAKPGVDATCEANNALVWKDPGADKWTPACRLSGVEGEREKRNKEGRNGNPRRNQKTQSRPCRPTPSRQKEASAKKKGLVTLIGPGNEGETQKNHRAAPRN